MRQTKLWEVEVESGILCCDVRDVELKARGEGGQLLLTAGSLPPSAARFCRRHDMSSNIYSFIISYFDRTVFERF